MFQSFSAELYCVDIGQIDSRYNLLRSKKSLSRNQNTPALGDFRVA